MRILFASSEAVPFATTGGLGDVCGSLPFALANLGHDVRVIIPAYRGIWYAGREIRSLGLEFIVSVGSKTVSGRLLESRADNVTFYFVQQDYYYDRDALYNVHGQDYADNCERFVFFDRAVMEAIRLLDFVPDILHVHDWQTGLVPAYLKIEYSQSPLYRGIGSVLTIHNLAYQGRFWHWDMLLTGLDWKYFNWRQMEFYGQLSFLKTGIVFADTISTVSPRYAQEIQTPEFGWGLEGVLRSRRDVLYGILNGIDDTVWNPETDPHIACRYNAQTVFQGKAICKKALQEEMGLPVRPETPLISMIGRITHQKGFDMVADILPYWLEKEDAQWVILGTGDTALEQRFREFADRWPQKIAVRIDFCHPLAHRIHAGADIFVMPSRFEPCGLAQLQALRYGTVPVVREIGGLADTIVDCRSENAAGGRANGFSFSSEDPWELSRTLQRACETYRQPDLWRQLIQNGITQDWSWRHSAPRYIEMYEDTLRRVRGTNQ
ncbi:MAG: glycogen synthase GlgA [Thermogutta sp.]